MGVGCYRSNMMYTPSRLAMSRRVGMGMGVRPRDVTWGGNGDGGGVTCSWGGNGDGVGWNVTAPT